MSLFKDCDVRGVYPDEIDEEATYAVGRVLATLHPGARVAVGGDVRLSTPALKEALIWGLNDSGADVTDLGTIPTPVLYWSLKRLNVSGGATVTASHNPPRYNGVKFMFDDQPVTRKIMDEVETAVISGRFLDGAGQRTAWNPLPGYMADLERRFRAPRRLKIVVDAGNGAMSEIAPPVLRRCGYEVIELFCTPDGAFPNRDPNPAEYSHLGAVCQKVVDEGADLGVAFDGDGDRAVFIDDAGRPVINERSLALFIRKLLKDHPTPVVYDQKCSSAVRRAVLEMGGTPVLERSGHAFIKRRFVALGAAIAGEVSGHFFFGELGYDDALYAALTMAELVAESGRTLSALAQAIAIPPITPDLRVPCPYDQQALWLARVEQAVREPGCEVSHLDGVRLAFSDGWVLIRKSVTAEQITLRAEADTPRRLDALMALTANALPEEAARALLEGYRAACVQ